MPRSSAGLLWKSFLRCKPPVGQRARLRSFDRILALQLFISPLVFCIGSTAGTSVRTTDSDLLNLDPMVVSGIRIDLPWRYAQIDGYEVLSLCSTQLTVKVVEALNHGTAMMPSVFQVKRSDPVTVILFDDQTLDKKSRLRVTRKVVSTNRRFGPDYWLVWNMPGPETISDRDSLIYAACIPAGSDWEHVDFGPASHCFFELAPAPAGWLKEGLFGKFGIYTEGTTHVWRDLFIIPGMPVLSDEEVVDRGTKLAAATLLPLHEFLSGPAPDPIDSPETFIRWQSQSVLFVRWGLVADKKKPFGMENFWRFAFESARSRASEDLFQELFQRSYAEAALELQEYQRKAVLCVDLNLPGIHLPTPLRNLKLRPATEGEIARLKGNYERMEANRLKADQPKLAEQFQSDARRTLKRGLKATNNDPRIRGILGLLEFDAGNHVEARPHLEAAFAANQAGTHALIALARLRLDEERARISMQNKSLRGVRARTDVEAIQQARRDQGPEPVAGLDRHGAFRANRDDQVGSEIKLPPAAMERILTPLFAARDRRPSVPAVYHLIAEAWTQSEISPTPANLAVLVEGTEFFPEDRTLQGHTTALLAKHGLNAGAPHLTNSITAHPTAPETQTPRAVLANSSPPNL